jgi:hypothetical protein
VDKFVSARHAADDSLIWRVPFVGWITKAIETHSEYIILIAFPRQHGLRERASALRLCVHYLSCYLKDQFKNLKNLLLGVQVKVCY